VCDNIILRFTEFGGAIPNRPVEDIAFSVARFIQNGGSFMNYYMVNLRNLLNIKID
jgi:hypothetical protein